MSGAVARRAQEQYDDGPEACQEVLGEILASLRRIEMLAAHSPDDPLLAAAALRATEAAVAAENLTARQISVRQIKADYYARGRTDMAVAVADRKRLRIAR